jgi:hypothetical protein
MVAEARYDFGDVRVATLALLTLTAFPRRRYRQIFRPHSHFAKFADDLCRQIDIRVTPMVTWRPLAGHAALHGVDELALRQPIEFAIFLA